MKHRIVHVLQKYLLNPPIKPLLALGLAPPGYALLETTDRKSVEPRRSRGLPFDPQRNELAGNQRSSPPVRTDHSLRNFPIQLIELLSALIP
jgi:hypothetical protein